MADDIFGGMLQWLHPEPEEAGVVYGRLRARLIRFFEANGSRFPEDCVDETFDRIAAKIAEGTEVAAADPYVYARGVARNVMLEKWRQESRFSSTVDNLSPHNQPSFDPDKNESEMQARSMRERLLDCLDGCIKNLPDDSRQIFLDYHQHEQRTKIDNRSVIAERLGIDVTALRNRITRLRKKIEACATDCAEHGQAS